MKNLISILLVLITLNVFGYTTITSDAGGGSWTTGGTWVGGTVPDIEDWPNDKVIIASNVTYTGNLLGKASNGIVINANCTLTVSGTLTLNNTDLTIAAGGVLIASNLTITNTSIVTNAGTITVSTKIDADGGKLNTTGTVNTTTIESGASSGSEINVNGGTMTSTGDLILDSDGKLSSAAGSTINVGNDFNNGGSTSSTLSGDITIVNDFLIPLGATTTFNGNASVGGDLNGSGTGTVTIGSAGTMDITGSMILTNTSKINGDGIIGWAGSNVNNQTSNGRFICGGSTYDTNAGANSPDIPGGNTNNIVDLTDCSSATLPVELIYFEVTLNGDVVIIDWITASEINNDYFEVQVSTNGIDWVTIDLVNGAGNSVIVTKYRSYDSDIDGYDVKYYRLKQVDFDGKTEYSQIKLISFNNSVIFDAFTNDDNIVIRTSFDKSTRVSIYDVNGKIVHLSVMAGDNLITISNQSLSEGIYLINIESGGVFHSKKIFVKK